MASNIRWGVMWGILVVLIIHAETKFIDLTHQLSNVGMSYWPAHTKYNLKADLRGSLGVVKWVASNSFTTAEHMGSHLDSPYHFVKKGRKIQDIPLEELRGPAVVIDIKFKVRTNRNAEVDKLDLLGWEGKNGRIPDNAYIIMNSGWEQYWGDQIKYVGLNSTNSTRIDNLSWPGFSLEATNWLLKERKTFRGLAVDTLSCERGDSTTFPVHVVLLEADKMCVENVANLNKVAAKGWQFYVMPILIKEGTGAPARVFALVDEQPISRGSGIFSCNLHNLLFTILFFVIHQL